MLDVTPAVPLAAGGQHDAGRDEEQGADDLARDVLAERDGEQCRDRPVGGDQHRHDADVPERDAERPAPRADDVGQARAGRGDPRRGRRVRHAAADRERQHERQADQLDPDQGRNRPERPRAGRPSEGAGTPQQGRHEAEQDRHGPNHAGEPLGARRRTSRAAIRGAGASRVDAGGAGLAGSKSKPPGDALRSPPERSARGGGPTVTAEATAEDDPVPRASRRARRGAPSVPSPKFVGRSARGASLARSRPERQAEGPRSRRSGGCQIASHAGQASLAQLHRLRRWVPGAAPQHRECRRTSDSGH